MRQDLQHAIRQLWRRPGFCLAVVTTIAAGLGAVMAVFAVAYGLLLRPLPIQRPDEVLAVYQTTTTAPGRRVSVSGIRFDRWRESRDVFTDMAAAGSHSFEFVVEGVALRLSGELVSGSFFELLGVTPLLGRTLSSTDETASGTLAVPLVVSERFWRRHLAEDRNVLGRVLQVGAVTFTIVGVVPDAFGRWRQAQLWAPYRLTPTFLPSNVLAGDGYHLLQALGRLRPGVESARATKLMADVDRRVSEAIGQVDERWSAAAFPLRDLVTTPETRRAVLVLSIVSVIVLGLATANVAGLMLTRAVSRRRESAMRLALGADLWRLVRPVLLEGGLLTVMGTAAGLLLAVWAVPILVALAPATLAEASVIAIDLAVAACGTAAALFVLLVIVVVPVLQIRRTDILSGVRTGTQGWSGASGSRVHGLLVGGQAIIAAPVVAAATLLVTSVIRLGGIDLGFDPRQLMTMRVSLPGTEYTTIEDVSRFRKELLERVSVMPGVEEVAVSTGLPVSTFGPTTAVTGVSIEIEGGRRYLNGEPKNASFVPGRRDVTPGYFRTVGIQHRAGRDFGSTDVLGAPLVAIVNETMAQLHWPGENPIGKRVRFDWPRPRGTGEFPWTEIIGVVGDARHHRVDAPPRPEIYTGLEQRLFPYRTAFVYVRSSLPPNVVTPALRDAVQSLDPRVPLEDVRPASVIIADLTATPRYSAALVTLLGGIAVLLAAVGIYGLAAFAALQRTREIGIRLALGATRPMVLRQALLRALTPVVAGLLVGTVLAAMTMSFIRGLLYGVEAQNPAAFGVAVAFLLLVAAGAAYLPARRTARTDPLVALRSE
jgi:putative ABC transport system permease protein